MKLMGLHSWVIYYWLSEDCQAPASCESIFISNGICFRKSDKYALLHYDGLSEEIGSDLDARSSTRSRHRKKKKCKRKRKRNDDDDDDDSFDNELLDFDTSNSMLNLQSRAVSWFLSTDGFSATWTSADFPDLLSRHCLSTWMKCLFDKWNNVA